MQKEYVYIIVIVYQTKQKNTYSSLPGDDRGDFRSARDKLT